MLTSFKDVKIIGRIWYVICLGTANNNPAFFGKLTIAH
jgi:hypothetical protein